MTRRQINNSFNYHIIKNPILIIDKELFNLAQKMTLMDWRIMRNKEYWKNLNLKQNKKNFTLETMKEYLKMKLINN